MRTLNSRLSVCVCVCVYVFVCLCACLLVLMDLLFRSVNVFPKSCTFLLGSCHSSTTEATRSSRFVTHNRQPSYSYSLSLLLVSPMSFLFVLVFMFGRFLIYCCCFHNDCCYLSLAKSCWFGCPRIDRLAHPPPIQEFSTPLNVFTGVHTCLFFGYYARSPIGSIIRTTMRMCVCLFLSWLLAT